MYPQAALGQRLPAKPEQSPRLGAPVPGTRPAPSSCHLTLGRLPNLGRAGRREALGGALRPQRPGPGVGAAGVPAASDTEGARAGGLATRHPVAPALPGPHGPQPPCPTRQASPQGKRCRGDGEPVPGPPRRGAHTHSHSAAEPRPVRQPRPWRTWRPSPGLCSGSGETLEARAAAAAATAQCAGCPGPRGSAPRRRPHPWAPPQRPRPSVPALPRRRERAEGGGACTSRLRPRPPPCTQKALWRRKEEGGACPPILLAGSSSGRRRPAPALDLCPPRPPPDPRHLSKCRQCLYPDTKHVGIFRSPSHLTKLFCTKGLKEGLL